MKRKKKDKDTVLSNTNALIAVIFLIFIAFIIGISLLVKVVLVVRASQFDDRGRFTITISDNKNLKIISLSRSPQSMVIFEFDEDLKFKNAGHFLQIPIDGFIRSDSLNVKQEADFLFLEGILKYNNLKTNLTIVDIIRLFAFARGLPERAIVVKKIQNEELDIDKIVGRQFVDGLIEKEGKKIQIINGTNISGLGNKLAKLIANMGGDVIMVVTSDRPKYKSIISHIDEKSYTVERLKKILGFKAVVEDVKTIADITIVIGEDRINPLVF